MNQHKQSSDLDLGRGWLRTAERRFGEDENPAAAHAAAAIGSGFVHLALAELSASSMAETSQVRQAILTMSEEPETTLAEAIEREKRAEAEARPRDVVSLHAALALGIERGLRDVGADLSGCTPSMLTGHVIRQLRDTGPWEITPATFDGEVARG